MTRVQRNRVAMQQPAPKQAGASQRELGSPPDSQSSRNDAPRNHYGKTN